MEHLVDSDSDADFNTNSDDEMCEYLLLQLETEGKKKRMPCRTSIRQGHDWVRELLHDHPGRIYEQLRMERHIFLQLCEELKNHGLCPSKNITVQEQVAMFLMILAHSNSARDNAEDFQHSTATVSKYFGIVLKAVIRMSRVVIVPPNMSEVPPQILRDPKYYPYFKDCVGAIDGVHVDAILPISQQIPFRGRKGNTTQNVLCVCSFDMRFTYVVAGWEGSAHDARILTSTATDSNSQFPMPPLGKYYVVDSGFANAPGFLAPFRGYTSHFQEIRRRGGPRGREELFNYRHSSLRNVIERCFGVLKRRWPILKMMCSYSFSKQTDIVLACCALHNFIRMHAQGDTLFAEFEESDGQAETSEFMARIEFGTSSSQVREMASKRDRIANQMWSDECTNN
ncbi:Protein ALP1-like [Linum perenne]